MITSKIIADAIKSGDTSFFIENKSKLIEHFSNKNNCLNEEYSKDKRLIQSFNSVKSIILNGMDPLQTHADKIGKSSPLHLAAQIASREIFNILAGLIPNAGNLIKAEDEYTVNVLEYLYIRFNNDKEFDINLLFDPLKYNILSSDDEIEGFYTALMKLSIDHNKLDLFKVILEKKDYPLDISVILLILRLGKVSFFKIILDKDLLGINHEKNRALLLLSAIFVGYDFMERYRKNLYVDFKSSPLDSYIELFKLVIERNIFDASSHVCINLRLESQQELESENNQCTFLEKCCEWDLFEVVTLMFRHSKSLFTLSDTVLHNLSRDMRRHLLWLATRYPRADILDQNLLIGRLARTDRLFSENIDFAREQLKKMEVRQQCIRAITRFRKINEPDILHDILARALGTEYLPNMTEFAAKFESVRARLDDAIENPEQKPEVIFISTGRGVKHLREEGDNQETTNKKRTMP